MAKNLRAWKAKGKSVKVGDTVNVYVSSDEPRRRIKITRINSHYKGDATGGIEGITKNGSTAFARISQLHKFGASGTK